jgi:hypothetical protein
MLSFDRSQLGRRSSEASNGGPVVTSQGHPIEFVYQGQEIIFYVGDDDGSPLPTKQMKGRTTIQQGEKAVTVQLKPSSPNMMVGKADAEWCRKLASCSRAAFMGIR